MGKSTISMAIFNSYDKFPKSNVQAIGTDVEFVTSNHGTPFPQILLPYNVGPPSYKLVYKPQ